MSKFFSWLSILSLLSITQVDFTERVKAELQSLKLSLNLIKEQVVQDICAEIDAFNEQNRISDAKLDHFMAHAESSVASIEDNIQELDNK